MEHSYGYQVMPVQQEDSGSWAGYIALFLVIIIIIALLVYLIFTGGTTSLIATKYTIVQGKTGTSDTITPTAGYYYVVKSTNATFSLALTAPSDAQGGQFIIDNSNATATVVTLSGGSTDTIQPGEIATFVWTTGTTATLVARN